MSLHHQLLLCCSVSMLLLQCFGSHSGSEHFEMAALCPNVSSVPARFERSMLTCALSCSCDTGCYLFYFNLTTGLCYHGNFTCEGLALWSEGSCVSYRVERLSADHVVMQLGLKLLYRFATHGLLNAADPCRHRLRSGPETVLDAEGAHFVPSTDSFLMAETPGFEMVINKEHKFSFFVRAKQPLNIDATFAAFRTCGGDTVAHDFYAYNGNLWLECFWPFDVKSHLFRSGKMFDVTSSTGQVSVGVAFNTDRDVSFFFNGQMRNATADSGQPMTELNSTADFQCLHLGGFPEDPAYSVRGSVSCFAVGIRALSQQEFALLDNWCQQA